MRRRSRVDTIHRKVLLRSSSYDAERRVDGTYCVLHAVAANAGMRSPPPPQPQQSQPNAFNEGDILTISYLGAVVGSSPNEAGQRSVINFPNSSLEPSHFKIDLVDAEFVVGSIGEATVQFCSSSVLGERCDSGDCSSSEEAHGNQQSTSTSVHRTGEASAPTPSNQAWKTIGPGSSRVLKDGDRFRAAEMGFQVHLRHSPSICLNAPLPEDSIQCALFTSFGIASSPNFRWRDSMEDRACCCPRWLGENGAFFGVFDGHSGRSVADLANASLHEHLRTVFAGLPSAASSSASAAAAAASTVSGSTRLATSAFRKAFERTNREIAGLGDAGFFSGCTVVVATLTKPNDCERRLLSVANLGDCQAMLCRAGTAIECSQLHIASVASEEDRVSKNGGSISNRRLMGLEVTRSLGDLSLKPYGLSDQPYVLQIELQDDDRFIILASDGLWNVVSFEEAIELVSGEDSAQKMAAVLLEQALTLSRDNISIIVIVL